jgi:hypothetical protein
MSLLTEHRVKTVPATFRASWFRSFISSLTKPVSAAPFVTFRIVFGALMAFSAVRFMTLGWIEDHYVQPVFHFKYYGFAWVPVLPAFWLYVVHVVMIISALCVMAGFRYRLAAILLFLTFTYTELIDLTYYLNHYYFVSLVCFLLILLPASPNPLPWRGLSNSPSTGGGWGEAGFVPAWVVLMFKLQLAIVYTYAGLAKINYDWLINALPLKIWIPANDSWPLIGGVFRWKATPYVFAWIGMIYDCTIVFWLSWRKTRLLAYASVIIFHVLTGLMFQIGVFPLVMIGATLIFFSNEWHEQVLNLANGLGKMPVFNKLKSHSKTTQEKSYIQPFNHSTILLFLAFFFLFQLLFPWRYLLYPGNLFWTEEGYRFSWRVMLMEKAGTATFYVKDSRTGREGEVVNSEFLNAHQEKQMAMQPDMILQYAHFLADEYEKRGLHKPQVRAEVYVTLNAQPSRLLIDPNVDLAQIKDGWEHKTWILPDTD